MLKSRKTLRIAIPCLVLVGLALALSVPRWSGHAQSEQNPVTQSAQEPIRIRPMPRAVENLGAQAATMPNGPAATITVTSLADVQANNGQCTLREALINANNDNQSGSTDCASGSGTDTITFSVNGTINLTGVLPDISSNLTITGPGANLLTVRRNTGGDYRIFQINGGVSVDLTGLTISNGSVPASEGGGIHNSGVLIITNCAITGNLANGGGGIRNLGTLAVLGSTISGNLANFDGAGLHNEGYAELFNSTISGNTANGNVAGIINLSAGAPTKTLVVVNCTVTGNNGVAVGGIGTYSQGGTAETYLRNTIVANNSAPNLLKSGTNASVISQGNNLASDDGSGLLTQPSDKLNTDPQLLPLGNYGGATQTHALLASSPAVDAGTNVGAPANDQRGFARGVDGNGFGAAAYDIGAYEVRPKFVNVTTGNDANSGATLALAVKTIAQGIAVTATGDDLVIAGGTYFENNLVVNKSINFQGGGAANTFVNANQINRVFQINSGFTVGISNLTITNGKTASGQLGGGILNSGTLSLANCIISGNTATDNGGGGISSSGLLTISNSTISGNSAANNVGGGLDNNGGTLMMLNSTISGNTAPSQISALENRNGSAVLTNSTISGNGDLLNFSLQAIRSFSASGQSSSLTMTNCTVTNNKFEGIVTNADGSGVSVTQLKNTIIAASLLREGNGTVISLGNNLIGDSNGFLIGPGDLTNTNPMLAALANNGGPTKTHLLLSGSPAINAGSNTGAPTTDQRGVKRPVGANTDIGAVEVSSGTCATSVIYPSSLPPGAVGAIYNQQLTATGGTGPYVFSVATGSSLPAGLSLSSGGTLTGAPTTSGNPTFSLTVLDQNGCLSTQAFFLGVASGPCLDNADIPITIGQTVTGTLLPGDCASIFNDGSLSDVYTFNGVAGQQIAISLNSTDFDAYLGLNLPGGSFDIQDDNGGGGTNARIPANSGFFTLPTTGTYRIAANTFPGQTGNYSLTLSGPPNNGLQFYPLAAPVRLLDTRSGQAACTNPGVPITGGTALTQAARGTCGIPANAQAVTGNVTVVTPGANGFLTIYPSDAVTQPTAANTNFASGDVLNNVFTVGLSSATGSLKIFASTTANVVMDITGYYAPPTPTGLYFHPLPKPIRLLETRVSQPGCFTPGTQLLANTETIQQGRTTCTGVTIPATAKALVGNATAVLPSANGFLTMFPADAGTRPLAASGNYRSGINLNSPFTVGLSPAGAFKIYTVATTDLVVDVLGYYSSEAIDINGPGLLFTPLTPARLLDTRAGQPACFMPGAALTGGVETSQAASNTCTIALTARAIVGNATTVLPSANGFLTFWPSDAASRPLVATSNFQSGRNFNRYYTVGLGANGGFKMYASATTNLVVDVSGYFAP